jgi:acyl-CoA synthetase (AMP-forming)/AMP-acid ligase II
MEMSSVADCLVYGEKSPVTGNIVVARIQLKNNSKEYNSPVEIRNFLRTRLDRYKIPVKIRFVESIGHNDRLKKIRNI